MPTFIDRGRITTTAIGVTASGVLAAGALAHSTTIKPKTTGTYVTGKSFKHIAFEAVKRGKQYKLANFQINCMASQKSFGSIDLSKELTISSSGKFSYNGNAREFGNGQPTGSATLTLSGAFTSDTKVKGTATFSKPTHPLAGGPGRSFTATLSK
jgi:hypothetical protein